MKGNFHVRFPEGSGLATACSHSINRTFFQAVSDLSEGKFSHAQIEVVAPGDARPCLDQAAYLVWAPEDAGPSEPAEPVPPS